MQQTLVSFPAPDIMGIDVARNEKHAGYFHSLMYMVRQNASLLLLQQKGERSEQRPARLLGDITDNYDTDRAERFGIRLP